MMPKKIAEMLGRKIFKSSRYIGVFVIFLIIVYIGLEKLLEKTLSRIEVIKQILSLVSFIGGLVGVLIVEKLRKIWWCPYFEIESWQENKILALKYENGDINYRIRVKNIGNTPAINCIVQISLEDFKPEDIEKCDFSDEECQEEFGNKCPFIKSSSEFAEIEDEPLLWDFQPYGERPMRINIPPQTSFLVTIARFRKRGWYLELLSENPERPRVWLKIRPPDNRDNFVKEYKIKIKVCGDNFHPFQKEVVLKSPPYNSTEASLSVKMLYLRNQVEKQKKY